MQMQGFVKCHDPFLKNFIFFVIQSDVKVRTLGSRHKPLGLSMILDLQQLFVTWLIWLSLFVWFCSNKMFCVTLSSVYKLAYTSNTYICYVCYFNLQKTFQKVAAVQSLHQYSSYPQWLAVERNMAWHLCCSRSYVCWSILWIGGCTI